MGLGKKFPFVSLNTKHLCCFKRNVKIVFFHFHPGIVVIRLTFERILVEKWLNQQVRVNSHQASDSALTLRKGIIVCNSFFHAEQRFQWRLKMGPRPISSVNASVNADTAPDARCEHGLTQNLNSPCIVYFQ